MIRFVRVIFFIALFSINSLANAREYRAYDFKSLYKTLEYPSEDFIFDSSVNFFDSTEDEIQDLATYTSKDDTYYQEINGYLRFFPKEYEWSGIGPDDAKGIVKNIDSIFNRVPALPEDLILFRGVDLGYRNGKSYEVGEEFTEKAYSSTSTNFNVAKYFAGGINRDSNFRKAVFVFYLNKKNEKGILFNQGEDEVLLKHGEKIRVMEKEVKKTSFDIYFAQICDLTCDNDLNADAKVFWKNFLEKQTN